MIIRIALWRWRPAAGTHIPPAEYVTDPAIDSGHVEREVPWSPAIVHVGDLLFDLVAGYGPAVVMGREWHDDRCVVRCDARQVRP